MKILYTLIFIIAFTFTQNFAEAQGVHVYYKKFVVPGKSEYNRWMSSPEMKRRLREREEQMASNVSEYYDLYSNGVHSYFSYDTTISLIEIQEEQRWWSRADIRFSYAKHLPSGNVTVRTDILPDSLCRSINFKEEYKWKFADGEKVFAGLRCQKAYFLDEAGDTTLAWYAPSLPLSGGPEAFGGTPGMILAIEAPSFNYIAEEITLGKYTIPKLPLPSAACLPEKEFQEKVREAVMRKYINK